MSEQTSQEPTMEEILASIRRIISEDDAPAEEAAAEAAPEEPPAPVAEPPPVTAVEEPEPVAAAPEAASVADDEEDELELTEKVETHGDLDIYSASTEAPAVAPAPAAPLSAGLVSDHAASAAASSFGALSAAILMPKGDRTLEDVV